MSQEALKCSVGHIEGGAPAASAPSGRISGPEFARDFYAANAPADMVALALDPLILIDADGFRALLRSGCTEHWEVLGEDSDNPIVHLQRVFRV